METEEEVNLVKSGLMFYIAQLLVWVLRMTFYIIKRTVYALGFFIPRIAKQVAHDMKLVIAIYQGSDIIVLDQTEPEKVDKYHTRYDHSTRGNVGEQSWDFGNVKVNA